MSAGDPIDYNLVSFGPRGKNHIEWTKAKITGRVPILCGTVGDYPSERLVTARVPLHAGDPTPNLCKSCAKELQAMLQLDAERAREDRHGFLV